MGSFLKTLTYLLYLSFSLEQCVGHCSALLLMWCCNLTPRLAFKNQNANCDTFSWVSLPPSSLSQFSACTVSVSTCAVEPSQDEMKV